MDTDVMDSAGRARRLILALILGASAAAIAYFVADHLAKPDEMAASGRHSSYSVGQATRFVWYVTAFAGGGVFMIALAVQNQIAKRKWQSERIPKARRV